MLVENLPAKEILSKHFYDHNIASSICYDSLKKQIENTQIKEFSEAFLVKNLVNSQYKSIEFLDFQKFDKILRQRRQLELTESWSEADFLTYKKYILNSITVGSLPPPIILHDLLGRFILFSGEARMLAFKVLGINPVVKLIEIDQVLTIEHTV